MDELNLEILDSIDAINTAVQESEMNVLNALSNAYQKSIMILEYANDDSDLSAFDVFQEGEILDAATGKGKINKKGKQESIIKKILLFIPRLIKATFDSIKKFIINKKIKHALKVIQKYISKNIKEYDTSNTDGNVIMESNTLLDIDESGRINFDIDKFQDLGEAYTRMISEYSVLAGEYKEIFYSQSLSDIPTRLEELVNKLDKCYKNISTSADYLEISGDDIISIFITDENPKPLSEVSEEIMDLYKKIYACSNDNFPMALYRTEERMSTYEDFEGQTHEYLINVYRLFNNISSSINRFIITLGKVIMAIYNEIIQIEQRAKSM